MNILRETVEGREIIRVYDAEYHYSCGYYSNNVWLDDNRIVLSRSKDIAYKGSELVLFDIVSGEERLIVEHCNGYLDYVLHNDMLYYVSGDVLYSLNITSGETTKICENKGMHFPHMTKDGRYMNWETAHPERKCMLLDVETGKLEVAFQKYFADPLSTSNHYMVCPTDPDKIFFAHEGDTRYISNRLWLWEKDKGMRCIAKQRLDEDGNVGDCFGHECWAPDGKGLWFVKYRESTIAPKGLSYVDLEGNQQVAVYGKYPYWHVSVSADGRYLGADAIAKPYEGPQMKTPEEVDMSRVIECDCCVIDLKTGEEKSVAKVLSNSVHPCHPHPAFSPHSERICFHDFIDGQVVVGFTTFK